MVLTPRFAVALGLWGAGTIGSGCSGPAGGTTDGKEDGKAVFQTMCATCHGPDGRPPEAMVARIGVRNLADPEFRARVTPELVEHQVRAGSKTKLMPAFAGALSDAQITAVATWVASPQFAAPR